ncbi:hypothetical protein [Actinoplanes subtropicus]|uniref:hypothetical protein n=1 Tax=Actinoplanes subtropicus TaxID=543632 RepID=UPI0004C2F394|nr:hypothetical protein [Actinoplanes subtropicus]
MRVPPNRVGALVLRWAFRGGALLLGIGCLFALFRIESDYLGLLSHPAHAVATVEDTQGVGRQEDYLITFTTPAGTPETLWTESLDGGTRVGDRVNITYDARRASNLREGHVHAVSMVAPAVLLLAVAAVLFWQAISGMSTVPAED